MRSPASAFCLAGVILLSAPLAPGATVPSRSPAANGARTGKGPLPDPLLLDGSGQPAEKRPETGLLGEFELPGEENTRDGKVGGQSGVAASQPSGPRSADGQAAGLPSGGSSSGSGAPSASGAPAGAQAGTQGGAQAGGQAAGAGGVPGGEQGAQNAGGSPVPGGGDANAKADGVQVGGLSGDGSPQGAVAGGKPAKVAIGDSAMRIETGPAAPGVVGTQLPPGPVQQHEKGTGTGGKGAAGAGGNRGVERGRSIPSGL